MHFEGFTGLVQNRNNDSIHKSEDDDSQPEDDVSSESDENDPEEGVLMVSALFQLTSFIFIPFFFCVENTLPISLIWIIYRNKADPYSVPLTPGQLLFPPQKCQQIYLLLWKNKLTIIWEVVISKKIRESLNSYKTNTTDEEKYTYKVFDHFIFCLENRPEYFAQRPTTEGTFRARFIEPIMEPFIFIFKDLMNLTWGEISSLSSATRRNFQLEEGKRRRIGSKSDCIGTFINAKNF